MALQHLRSGTAHKRPIPTVMSAGQIAINTNEASPGLFFKDSNGDLVKVGPVHIGTTAPNSSPDSVAATALVTGTVYQILTVGTSDFTLVGASANTVGTIFTATGTTTGTGTVSGQQGVEKGEQWLDTTGGAYDLKIYDGTDWRSQAGEFVNVTGDTMTGALLLDNAASVSAPDLSFDGDANTGIYSPGADQFGVATAGTSRLVIDSSGRLLVGTSSTSADCNSVFVGSSTSATSIIHLGRSSSVSNGSSLGAVAFGDSSQNTYAQISANADAVPGASDYPGRLVFSTTADGASSPTERMRIDSSGRVGIGTSSPSTSLGAGGLHVTDRIAVGSGSNGTPALHYDGDTDTGFTFATARIGFVTGATERLRIDSSGNVGIGTSSPTQKLSLQNGTFVITGTSTFNSGVEIGRVGGDNNLAFATGGTERMRIDSSGVIKHTGLTGAGGANKVARYVVPSHNTNEEDVMVFQVENESSFNQITFGGGTSSYNAATQILFRTASAVDTVTGSERMRIDSSGNVGIGTTSPNSFLHVDSNNTYGSVVLSRDGGAAGRRPFGIGISGSTDSNLRISASSDTSGANAFANQIIDITADGNVGIGTVSPAADLHVAGDDIYVGSDAVTRIRNDGSLAIISSTYITGAGYKPLAFFTSDTERMRIDSNGNVFFGKTSQSLGTVGIRAAGDNIGLLECIRSGGQPLAVNRLTNDGHLIQFYQNSTLEGAINVSGTSVTLSGGHLSRWSQLAGGAERTEILRGSVLSNLDEMCEWGEEDNEQLNRMKVSDVEGDPNVAGVFQSWDDDDDTYTNDFYCAMTGDFVIRIAQGTTVARGDLLMSAGDGTAKPQDDDIVRSKTIAKVTSTVVSETYADGSYCVPCVLMAC